MILVAIGFPLLMGILLEIQAVRENCKKAPGLENPEAKGQLHGAVTAALALNTVFSLVLIFSPGEQSVTLWYLIKDVPIYFRLDGLGKVFMGTASVIWLLAGIFSLKYMEHEKKERRYFGFYFMVYGVLMGLYCAGNLVTMYLFYELLTLSSMPLVLHTGTREAIMAGLKYLLYSLCGAYMALFGVFVLCKYSDAAVSFAAGGSLNAAAAGHEGLLLLAVFFMILGFGVKAGMFPMHAWLVTAHPVAPAPASAVLSSVIVKAGVLAMIRAVFYSAGAELIRGTWVQDVWIVLSLITVFMGSMQAYREKVLKKRLAYSTVSQVSYILFGLAVLQPEAMAGSLLHVVFHGVLKCALFLCAGAVIFQTGKTRVDELTGIGKQMPVTAWSFTIASLGLVGIPPVCGFISKWHLAEGALDASVGAASWLGPVILLISALLTAGYLLPVTMKGFFPGADADYTKLQKNEAGLLMTVPLLILAVLAVLLGLIPGGLTDVLYTLSSGVL